METLLVRLKPYDPRRGFVLRRFTYLGIRFQSSRGWYRVEKRVADYLRAVREVETDLHSPLAFDVLSEAEARALETSEADAAKQKRSAADDLKVMPARTVGAITTDDLARPPSASLKDDERDARRGRRERE